MERQFSLEINRHFEDPSFAKGGRPFKIVGFIPSRMDSMRFPGKALEVIGGLPMVIRVWMAARDSGAFDELYVATDSPPIAAVCREYGAVPLLTDHSHPNPTSRIREAASMIPGDFYGMIGGDEPLLTPADIRLVTEAGVRALTAGTGQRPFAVNGMGLTPDEREAADPSNIKVVCALNGDGLYASRTPIPSAGAADFRKFPRWKFVSVGVYTREALDFFAATPPGPLEQAEEFDLLRFLEHGKPVRFIPIKGRTLSVDTPADLEAVERILEQNRFRNTTISKT